MNPYLLVILLNVAVFGAATVAGAVAVRVLDYRAQVAAGRVDYRRQG